MEEQQGQQHHQHDPNNPNTNQYGAGAEGSGSFFPQDDRSGYLDESVGGSYADGGGGGGGTVDGDGDGGGADEEQTYLTGDDSVPDMMLLNVYCARAKAPGESEESKLAAERSWQPVREWLGSHNAEQVRTAAEQRGESGLTALHFSCRHVPPLDVIDVLLSIAANTVQWCDSFGWLPIHYACASGSGTGVIKALAEAYPESKTTIDRRGRTPLHFSLGDKPAPPDVIFLLSSSGAASYKDEIGMLPLHYACAFGAAEEVLYVLTDAYPDAMTTRDRRERTPLHFALSNAGRKTVPAAVKLLLRLNRDIVNSIEGGPLPLRVLAEYASTVRGEDEKREEKRESVVRCLEHLLNAEPDPTADFFSALQSLPDWLSERAVVMPVVQELMNEKISQRFPTAVLMGDLYVQLMVIVAYSINVVDSIEKRNPLYLGDPAIDTKNLVPLYIGAAYFVALEVVQIISLFSLKSLNIWFKDPTNYLNVAYVVLIYFWAYRMDSGTGDYYNFRIGTALSVIVLWLKLLAYLRNIYMDFAVFVSGVFYVVHRLAAFLTALIIILIAFAQMFYTVFMETDYCNNQPNDSLSEAEILVMTACDANALHPFCNFWDSFLAIYTMLLGEVDETAFESSRVATALFIIFMFLVVILLANVLIAIVTDSYKVIQDTRAAIEFWTNRLDFVAEMDGIANGPWKNRLRKILGCGSSNVSDTSGRTEAVFGRDLWKQIMDLYEDEIDDSVFSIDFVAYTTLRLVAGIVIPLWIILGLCTIGILWPPQVREAVFTSKVNKHSSDTEKEDELRKTQVKKLEEEVKELKDELMQELVLDRTQVVQMKSLVAERKVEIYGEMRDIKKIVAMLFERQITS